MSASINGLHHVTAISGAPQRNLDFYVKVLGLRFVKRTVNFDDPSVYHLYYGNEIGAPGTAMTFFPWDHLPPARRGTGEVALTAFAVPVGSLEFWRERLTRLKVPHGEAEPRFDEPALALADPDGLPLALVASPEADPRAPWTTPEIDADHAVRGFHGVTLMLDVGAATAELLTEVMGYRHSGARTACIATSLRMPPRRDMSTLSKLRTARRPGAGGAPSITSRSRSPTTMPRTGSASA